VLDPETTESVAATFCATLVDEWVRAGVTDAVVAPGSRSTPLALALAADVHVRVHVHHDERSAGFLALGLGMERRRPAIVLTTSGTAAVELHPAVVEAHEARVPLLVCTADRPPELHGVGAPQTIDQQHLYGRAVRRFVDAGAPDAAMAGSWRSLAAEVVVATMERPPGPVHLNLPFRDPLVGVSGRLPRAGDTTRGWHLRAVASSAADDTTVDSVASAIAGRRGIIVAGGGIDQPDGVQRLADRLGWPVLADPRSGCRTPATSTVSHFDALLRVPSFASRWVPEVVLRLGSLPASKVLGQWLAGLDAWQLAIDVDGVRYDPDRQLGGVVAAEPGETCARLAAELEGRLGAEQERCDPDWRGGWVHADALAAEAIASTLVSHAEPTEPAVARDVVRALPDGAALVVSSSMPVRDVEWFASPRDELRVLANRGANGIDGVVSTAVGVALARSGGPPAPTALLIGDVALLHDTNGLLVAAGRGIDLTVIVVDNDGGGIFSFLPQADALDGPQFERLFGTPHGVDLAGLVAAHGIACRRIDRQVDVAEAVATSAAAGGVQVLLVRTDRAANVAVHREIDAAVGRALTPA
jgi:2-succinyl-5-enolpyruvyl-6-hydroxy-3-cyclohexene-1-carboxylate synthase